VRIALDATYSVDSQPTGIAVYSQELIAGLAQAYSEDEYLCCYRVKQFRRATRLPYPNIQRRWLLPPMVTFRAQLFHALNQRVDRRPAKRVIATFHDLFVMTGEYSSPKFRLRFSQQARQAALRSDCIIAVSEFTANQVHELLGVERSRIQVIPHGVKQRSRKEAGERKKMILSVGALQIRKNTSRLVKAFEATSPEWTLVLAGSPSGYRAAEILKAIEQSPARSRIRLAGYVDPQELERLYSQASIFAFPSLAEGFGIPVIEAMARGIPVVTSNGSACGEVAGGCALLVEPTDTEEIAEALLRLSQDSELRSSLAERGKLHAKHFSWERAVSSTHQLYKQLVS
jgi:glycosyltransferase involved in cell wall biosynthesis